MSREPIDTIEWVPADTLWANGWNPNRVFRIELALLERSMLSLGWIQPLLATPGGQIIDGFHRWRLAQDSEDLMARYRGKVPVARLDVDEPTAMAITVRINRAKGTHVAVQMSELVHRIVHEFGWDPKRVGEEIGATLEEITLLLQDNVFTQKNIKDWAYSKAWYPQPFVDAEAAP